ARADVAEHLEAALQLVLVVGAERAGEGPGLLLDFRRRVPALFLRHRGCGAKNESHQGGGNLGRGSGHWRADPDGQCLARTASEMLAGKGFGVSRRPSSGRTTRK